MLSDVGGPGQQRLKAGRVAIVGLGGVGAPAALYLAAAGIGGLTLIDDDAVSLSNLQRQVLFSADDLGRPKVQVGQARLHGLNPHVDVQTQPLRLTTANAEALLSDHDAVIDGTDDFETRLAVNAACVALKAPLVSGALGRWDGQVGVFHGRPCYRCLVPDIPPDAETCARVGVIGALAGVIGAMTALEAIKIVVGAGRPLAGRLLLYDGLAGATRTVTVPADPACPTCAGVAQASPG